MSQPNNPYPPTFSYNENFFDPQSSHTANPSFSPWTLHSSRPVVHTAPSPSPSVQTSRTAPNSRPARISWVSSIPRDTSIGPNLPNASLLAPPQTSRPHTAIDNVGQLDPIARFYDDAPWSSHNPRGPSVAVSRPYHPHSSIDYGSCRGGSGSEIDGSTRRSDSGYFTHHPHSVMSNDPDRVDLELPSELQMHLSNMNVDSASSERTDVYRVASTDHTSQYSGRSTNQTKEFKCVQCKEVSKCKSDYKKHMLKHDKPFKCDMPNCRRGGKGFTTENDLVRHKKSVHRIGMLQNSWRCASDTCRNREKIWPRLDNFKQHIHRMHQGENELDLIKRSAYQHQEPVQASQSLSVAPMETQLAGIGTEKQFPGNDFNDPVSGISLTPDQDSSNWDTFDPTSHDFAMDVDQTNATDYGHDSRRESRAKRQARLAVFELRAGTAHQNHNLGGLDTLATVASTHDKTSPLRPPQLSNAPQTKADQQRQALQKFSKIVVQGITNSVNDGNVDLEDVIIRVLSRVTEPDKKGHPSDSTQGSPTDDSSSGSECDILTKSEALKASQAIYALIKRHRSRPSPNNGFLLNKRVCEICKTTFARSCDLRKHMKRHTKPYGCTYPNCHKRFGAKSDWKRHENSQHFQLESFRCQLPSPASLKAPCGELFYRAEMFKAHLEAQHRITKEEDVVREMKLRRIGKNGQGRFWCGFCETIVGLEKKRNAAWDERFDHIDNHFCKEKKGIEDWLCVEANKKKGDVEIEVDKYDFYEEEGKENVSRIELEGDEHSANVIGAAAREERGRALDLMARLPVPSSFTAPMERSVSSTSSSNIKNPRKRAAEPDVVTAASSSGPSQKPPQKRSRRDFVKYCCSCQSGPWAVHTYVDCMSCDHHLCGSCTVVSRTMGNEVGMAGLC